jgi:hypothetical protein
MMANWLSPVDSLDLYATCLYIPIYRFLLFYDYTIYLSFITGSSLRFVGVFVGVCGTLTELNCETCEKSPFSRCFPVLFTAFCSVISSEN